MSTAGVGTPEHIGVDRPVDRVVGVDGVPMSARCVYVEQPRAVVVALHGGATTSRYYDFPGLPELSLLRTGVESGYTVLAIDRPGYGASPDRDRAFDDPQRRVDATFSAVERLLEERSWGAGLFVVGHSAGCDLAVRMAADPRGDGLLGLEIAGTGTDKFEDALRIIEGIRATRNRSTIRDLLWQPEELYPEEVRGGRSLTSAAPHYETAVAVQWPRDFAQLAPQVRVPVRLSCAEHERVWRTDEEARTVIAGLFSSSPRFVDHTQPASGHNISVGFGAPDYHRSVLAFVEECITEVT
ncbi:alpha/beta hydrolase [Rhodococcus artemisiae]|uniref:Alpha/beta fold hydrolase n=1 Tax=Rhodococcus artemisiae TaxID=714159 RepID=A0ABU7LB07_9NOCA|nr:alpha/beta fold hydrolase [Rhodococcus artemisiae]MEE2058499.1 alpha/beta fold hydrolase [Rhodococcus artemisiae]